MAAPCQVCRHPQRKEIDLALFRGGSVRVVATQFGYPEHSPIARHKRNCLHNVLQKVALETEVQVRAELQPEMDTILEALMTLYQQLGVCCRHHCLALIEQLESQHGDIRRVGSAD